MFTQITTKTSGKALFGLLLSVLAVTVFPFGAQAKDNGSAPLRRWPIEWQQCQENANMQCGSATVPLNWHRPHTPKKVAIGLMKLPAHNAATSKGALIVNLGGPGTTLDGFARLEAQFDGLRQQFDIVAFDPRGFGKSSGVTCPSGVPDISAFQANPLGEWQNQQRVNQQFFKDCEAAGGELVNYLDSWQVAHDIDAIRQALGQKKLNYFGTSYGTVYGQVYASQFPDTVERMFLDSVVDHTEPSLYARKAPVATQVKNLLPRINDWCATAPDCALRGQDVLAVWDEVHAIAQRGSIPGANGQKMTAGMLRSIGLLLTNEGAWPFMTAGLAQAKAGDASMLLSAMAARYPSDLLAHARCSDFNAPSYGQTVSAMSLLRRFESRFMWQLAVGTDAWCIGRQATYPAQPLNVTAIAPILLTNGLYDTGTAPSEGKNVARQLPGATWFGVEGYHSVYLFGNNSCTQQIVTNYFATGKMPDQGHICKKEA